MTPTTPTPSSTTRRTYGYVRVSTAEQSREGVSLDAQRDKIKSYCDLHSLDLADVMEDAGISGTKLDRPGLQHLLDLARAGEVGHVVVYKTDRLSRSLYHLLQIMEDVFKSNGVNFHSVMENVDTTTPMGKFYLNVMGSLNQMVRDQIAENTREALRFIKSTGRHVGAPPFGHRMTDDRGVLVAVEDDAPALAIIGELRGKGKTYRDIAHTLNRRHVKTQRGGRWDHSTVRKIYKRVGTKGAVCPQTGGRP